MRSAATNPTDASHSLTEEGETQWRELLQHMQWEEGFGLFVLFCDLPWLLNLYHDRIAAAFKGQVVDIERVAPENTETLMSEVLTSFEHPGELFQQMRSPLWLELYAGLGIHWDHARDNCIARLNERRELLRTHYRRPLVIVMPRQYRAKFRETAPDLWSIRDYTDEPEVYLAPPEASLSRSEHETLPVIDSGVSEHRPILEWNRLLGHGAQGDDVLNAGWLAIDAALEERAIHQAADIATAVEAMARELCGSGTAVRLTERCWL